MLFLAGAGTVVVYTIDRLRDVDRDASTAPGRSAFIAKHRKALLWQTALAGAAALGASALVPPGVLGVAAAVAVLGLFHRRLKRFVWVKPAYLTLAWTAVCVGFPAVSAKAGAGVLPAALVVGATLQANVALSNLRDNEGLARRLGRRRVLYLASAFLALAIGVAWTGGPALLPLIALPIAALPTVAFYRPGERYGGLVVDGALVVGGAAAWIWAAS